MTLQEHIRRVRRRRKKGARPENVRRNAVIRNLNRLGCPIQAISEGFGLSNNYVHRICAKGSAGNPCAKHFNVCSWCRDCARPSMGGLAP